MQVTGGAIPLFFIGGKMNKTNDWLELHKTEIGEMCRKFRIEKLKYRLEDMEALTGFKRPTISAFEHGKSTNMLILLSYYKVCYNEHQKDYFIHRLFDLM